MTIVNADANVRLFTAPSNFTTCSGGELKLCCDIWERFDRMYKKYVINDVEFGITALPQGFEARESGIVIPHTFSGISGMRIFCKIDYLFEGVLYTARSPTGVLFFANQSCITDIVQQACYTFNITVVETNISESNDNNLSWLGN